MAGDGELARGQTLVILALGSVVYAIIESNSLGWTSPVILGLLVVAVLGALGILGYEPRRVDPRWSCACSAACRSARRS